MNTILRYSSLAIDGEQPASVGKKTSHFPEIEAHLQDSEGPKAINVFLFMSEPHQAHPATAVCAALHEVVVPAEKKKRVNGATRS